MHFLNSCNFVRGPVPFVASRSMDRARTRSLGAAYRPKLKFFSPCFGHTTKGAVNGDYRAGITSQIRVLFER